MKALYALALVFAIGCASLAPKPKPAEPHRFSSAWQKECREEEQKFCSNWKEADGTRADCLARQEKELSGRCYQALKEAAAPCLFDRARWCSRLKPSDPKVWSCLQEQGKQVSLSCRTFRSEVAVKATNIKKACAADADKFCSDESGAPWRCLRKNLEKVSLNCRGELAKSLKGKRSAG